MDVGHSSITLLKLKLAQGITLHHEVSGTLKFEPIKVQFEFKFMNFRIVVILNENKNPMISMISLVTLT